MNKLFYNGNDLTEFGLFVSGGGTYNAPEKDYTKVSVPGRNGDLVFFNNRFMNIEVEYEAIIVPERAVASKVGGSLTYENCTSAIRNLLLSTNGYVKIKDDYHPDEYRLGIFTGPIEFDTIYLEAGMVTLTFECQPQRFKDGEAGKDIIFINVGTDPSSGGVTNTVINNSAFNAKSLIKLTRKRGAEGSSYPYGLIIINGKEIDISNESNNLSAVDIYIDLETYDCYTKTVIGSKVELVSLNNIVTVKDFDWPYFIPGTNHITISRRDNADSYAARSAHNIGTVTITPRWWDL